MWPPWKRSPSRIHTASKSNFSCSSFKDIQTLCKEEAEHNRRKKNSIFHRVYVSTSVILAWASRPSRSVHPPPPSSSSLPPSSPPEANVQHLPRQSSIHLPGADKRIVVYFTSLRVIRRTFEDCRDVRSILRGFRLSIDERDLSMDSRFLEELQQILGCRKLTLPRVFIGGRYFGGADEIRELHEAGELKKYLEGFPMAKPGVCEECNGYRFVLCDQCHGSRKFYTDDGGFVSCLACNENGLIRCSTCSSLDF
ncbi:PREDICTED: uncharacterized protein At5g39865-like [Nelumbo nucifera]|uniref:Uncharacterized protein At5g39865-like n=1 Tax=Nelumbo nucifera TaxID=4432 RepID=A0A1U8A6P9_NELNU|nr:PREDICTED: uncharacterized protein At5g39865-like [Nelumbo nucifera]